MADAAVFTTQHFIHANRVGAFLWNKYFRMAVGTIQPLGVRDMWKLNPRHISGIFKKNIQIHSHYLIVPLQISARVNHAKIESLYPIDSTAPVIRKTTHRFTGVLQGFDCGIFCIMDTVFIQSLNSDFSFVLPISRQTLPRATPPSTTYDALLVAESRCPPSLLHDTSTTILTRKAMTAISDEYFMLIPRWI